MNIDRLQADLIRDEGLRLKPYRCTSGKLTVGVGRNLDDMGISRAEALNMLAGDIEGVARDLDRGAPWWRELPEPAARALANMCFNLGWPRLSGFKRMLAALEAGQFARAAAEALTSKWADQVGRRADRIAALLAAGREEER